MPVPEPILKEGIENVLNEKSTVSLKSTLPLQNKSGLKYMWEFKNASDTGWMPLRQTPSESVVLLTEKDLIKSIIKKNLEIQLRYKSYSREVSGPYSDPITLEFTPTAPKVNKEFIKIEPTCPNRASGKISFSKIITNADSAAWFVIRGTIPDETATVDFLLSNKVNAENLDPGNYTAVVYNAGMKTGNVFTAVPFSIEKYPSLSVRKTEKKDATCPKAEDGEITIEADGGAPGKLKFFISPSSGKIDANNRSAIFRNILPGYYSIIISDACEQIVNAETIEIKSINESLHGSINKITPPVDNEANGFLNVSIEGGSGSYSYVLSKDGATPVVRSSSNFITIDRIQKGSYKLSITDSRLTGCSAWDTSFTVVSINSELSIDTAAVQKEAEMKRLFYGAPEKKAVTNAAFKPGAVAGDYIIVIEKSAYTLKVYNSKKELIVTYPVVFGNDLLEDKMVEGDKQTPEGYFTIIEKKEHDKWNKFLLLDYPTAESYRRFIDRKAKNLIPHNAEIGHSIGIHGIWANDNITVDMKKNWTDGCISTKNIFIEELYNYMPVGTRVLIKK
jgi:lipoprotein-anchoring transpeptidase ErfK/SrfK